LNIGIFKTDLTMMNITIKPLSPDLLEDYLFFFDTMVFSENPDWTACYCYSFHFTGATEEWQKEKNRSAVSKLIIDGLMKGYLAYSKGKPVGWCNANNRLKYSRLLKYNDLIDNPTDKVCSVVCFVISPEHRRSGIARLLLEQIIGDYSHTDYDYIEAYPGKGNLSCEKHYKGPLAMYEKFDFKIEKEMDDYYVLRKYLK